MILFGKQPAHAKETKEMAQGSTHPKMKCDDEVLARLMAGIQSFLSNENVLNKKRNEGN